MSWRVILHPFRCILFSVMRRTKAVFWCEGVGLRTGEPSRRGRRIGQRGLQQGPPLGSSAGVSVRGFRRGSPAGVSGRSLRQEKEKRATDRRFVRLTDRPSDRPSERAGERPAGEFVDPLFISFPIAPASSFFRPTHAPSAALYTKKLKVLRHRRPTGRPARQPASRLVRSRKTALRGSQPGRQAGNRGIGKSSLSSFFRRKKTTDGRSSERASEAATP